MHKTDDALVERIASSICKSGKFETGQGTCAMLCMDILGSARSKPCHHATKVHGDLARAILAVLPQFTGAAEVTQVDVMREQFPRVADHQNAAEQIRKSLAQRGYKLVESDD